MLQSPLPVCVVKLSMSERFDEIARYLVLAMGIAIPLNTPAVSITSGLMLLFWMLAAHDAKNLREKVQIILTNPVAVVALVLWGVIGLGMLHGSQSWHDALEMWWRYRKLLIIAVIITLLQDYRWRRWAEYAFVGTMLFTLVQRYGYALDWWWSGGVGPYAPRNAMGHITHNILMAFTAYWVLQRMWQYEPVLTRWQYRAYGLVVLFAVSDVLFLTPGRTGWVVLAALSIFALYQRWKWRGVFAALLFLGTISVFAFQFSKAFHSRVTDTVSEVNKYSTGDPTETSFGQRVQFYKHSLEIMITYPLLGGGTGSFRGEYNRRVSAQETHTENPHNEYFALGTQIGFLGLGVFLYMLVQQWRLAATLPGRKDRVAQGVLLTIVTGSLLNSLLFDFHDGHFYAYFIGLLYASLGQQEDRAPATQPDKSCSDTL